MEQQSIPAAGERYRHFNNRLYQVVTVAKHSETGEKMVIYQALYGDFEVYARPLSMFMGEVDHKKYPDVTQKYRFEKIESIFTEESLVEKQEETGKELVEPKEGTEKEIMPNDVLMNFLDADTYAEKLKIVRGMKKHIDNKMVHDFAVCLDIVLDEKPLEEQIRDIENCLKTYVKYECSRLR